jgi:hypothetical protein
MTPFLVHTLQGNIIYFLLLLFMFFFCEKKLSQQLRGPTTVRLLQKSSVEGRPQPQRPVFGSRQWAPYLLRRAQTMCRLFFKTLLRPPMPEG